MEHRLPDAVVPQRYDLRLEPDLEAATYRGEVTVTVAIREPVHEIAVNAVDLEVLEVTVGRAEETPVTGASEVDAGAQRLRFRFPRELEPGQWQLHVAFAGVLNDQLHGFYRSTYRDAEGRTHVIAATQFEAVDARRAFPCWDEPARKAVFAVTLVVPEGYQAVSNTRIVAERWVGVGRREVTFADTMPMSTYLVAFIVGELEATLPVLVGDTPVRVWCVPGKSRLARFAQEAGVFSLRFFEQYYGIPYPSDKLDLLAIPDFASGAMENLGAVTFREALLLVDEAAASHAELERVADVVAHEIAHMWFGDLVTMTWWNGIWLNEAFATFMEMLAVHAWKPEWQRWVSFGVSRAAAMGVDGLVASRPIEFEVKAPKDCEAMFDLLTYEKGASVLRMLEQHLGPDTFREGVRQYLREHAHGNAETTDLWEALGAASGQPIPEVMDGWIFHPGYPLVSVECEDATVRLAQRRFTYLDAADPMQWQVPVTLRAAVTGRVVERKALLGPGGVEVALPGSPEWVVANAGGHGFYRVRYAPDLLDRLTGNLRSLEAIERFNLVSDLFALTQAGGLGAPVFLEVTGRFRDETDRNVWAALLGALAFVNRCLDDDLRPAYAALVRDRLGPAAARLGWEPRSGESELTRQLRGDLLRALGVLGDDPATHERASLAYRQYREQPGSLDPNVLSAVIPVVATAGGAGEYAEFAERFRDAGSPQEEQRFLYALAAFRDPTLIRETLDRTINGSIRTQDAPYVVRSLMASVWARGQAWGFVRDHWQTMGRLYPPSAYRRMFDGVTALVRAEWEAEVHAFFEEHRLDLGGKTLAQYLEQLRIAVEFRTREGPSLRRYLSS